MRMMDKQSWARKICFLDGGCVFFGTPLQRRQKGAVSKAASKIELLTVRKRGRQRPSNARVGQLLL